LISKFGFTNLILREFIYDFWINSDKLINLIEINRILKMAAVIIDKYFNH